MFNLTRQLVPCRFRGWFVVMAVILLSACSSTWSAKVTTYQNWPTDAFYSSYFIVPSEQQVNSLQFQAVADSVRVALGAAGFTEGNSSSRLQVHLKYENPVQQEWVERYTDPYVSGYHSNVFLWGGIGYSSYFGSGFYNPRMISTPVNVYLNTLEIKINDNIHNNAEIYTVRVISKSNDDVLIELMPYLAQAAFTDFPGANGKTQYIKIKRNP